VNPTVSVSNVTSDTAESYLSAATTSVCSGITGATSILSSFKIPMPDIQGYAATLLAQSPNLPPSPLNCWPWPSKRWIWPINCPRRFYAMTTIPNQISRDMLAIDALQSEIKSQSAALAPATVQYLNEIEQRSRESLLKYNYYMAKAYEYRLLQPYQGVLDLSPMIDQILTLASTTSCTLTSDQFNSLEALYQNQISELAESIYDHYISNPPPLTTSIDLNLTSDQIKSLNAGQPVTLNLVEMGLFPPNEENIRIDDITLDNVQVHKHGAGTTNWPRWTSMPRTRVSPT